uniref:Uncharacterized protein n=1 Tax=Loigolactobacillus rennini TaxID=238013 RepID=A0A1K2I8M7_9LACO|nr:hypothetical protein LREN565_1868 [Loigolactobacillus rennini]
MFEKLFKKRTKENKTTTSKLSQEERISLQNENKDLLGTLKKIPEKERPIKYDQLGKNYMSLNELDSAIEVFETSLKIKEQFGVAYNNLLNLYEIKRKKAAEQKDNQEIQKWNDKTDSLLALSKRVMRSSL